MTGDITDEQLVLYRRVAADLRGGYLFETMVRGVLMAIYDKPPAERGAELNKMLMIVRAFASATAESNGVILETNALSNITGAVAVDALAFLANMPAGGHA